LLECRFIEHRRRLNQSASDKDRDAMLDESLQNFLKHLQNHSGGEAVILGLPDWMMLMKTAELPSMPEEKREKAIAHEARHIFPASLPDMIWKHAAFGDTESGEASKQPFTVAYIGARQSLLIEFLARLKKMGFIIAGAQCDMAALYNFSMFQNAKAGTDVPTALFDIGSDRLNILISSKKRIWHRSIMFGADRINKALVREFKLTHAQAESWKCNPAIAPSPGKMFDALQGVYEEFVQEAFDSLTAYRKAFPEEKITQIIGCGGGFACHDLPRYFLWRK
jgi:Tfp pilus assembly PilM family ATPase